MESLADVQRFFMLLSPDAAGVKSRLCVLGKKRLPSARRHEVGASPGSAGSGHRLRRACQRAPGAAGIAWQQALSTPLPSLLSRHPAGVPEAQSRHALPPSLPPSHFCSASLALWRPPPRTQQSCWRAWVPVATRPRRGVGGGWLPWLCRMQAWRRTATDHRRRLGQQLQAAPTHCWLTERSAALRGMAAAGMPSSVGLLG